MRRYQDLAFRVAYVIVGSAEEADDAAQEAFIRAYHALGAFRPGAPLRPWLLTIVSNVARTRRTSAVRRPTLTLDAARDAPLEEPSASPEAMALANERRQELWQAVQALAAPDQQVIAYRYVLELNEAEMADALGCPRGTVKSRLSRALHRLRGQLAEGGEAHG